MRIIDLSTWDRTEYYLFFKRMDYAHYNIGAELDITHYLPALKTQGLKFSFAMTYAATHAMNMVEAFRYRIRGEDVILHDKLHPSFSYLAPGDKYFKMVTVDLAEPVAAFVEKASEKALRQEKPFVREDVEGRDDLIYISSIPWVSFTHLSHTISFNKSDAVPRISWGKYYERDGKTLLPFNVQAHHSFVDGNHMGEYINRLQEHFDRYA